MTRRHAPLPVLTLALAVLLTMIPLFQATAARFVDLESREIRGVTYVSLDELTRAINATTRYDGALETGTVRVAGRGYVFLVGSRVVRSGDHAWNLLAPVVSDDNRLWITADFVNHVITAGSELSVSIDGARLLLSDGPGIQSELPPSPNPLPEAAVGPQRVRRVIIDPSHGGGDLGAALPGGAREKWATLELAREVADGLRAAGYDVALTRNEDRDLQPEARAAFANQMGGDLFLSLGAGAWVPIDARSPDDQLWVVVHGSVGPVDEPASVAGFRLRDWPFAQEPHLRTSAALATQLAKATGAEIARVPLRVVRGVNMPAAALVFSPGSAARDRWATWRGKFVRDVVRAVRAFERGGGR